MSRRELTSDRLRELLSYDLNSGVFTRLVKTSNRIKIGDVAGYKNPIGYCEISADGISYFAHRLAWLYVTNVWPIGMIDHINRDRGDNRFVNLRDVSNTENQQNISEARKTNPVGILGVQASGRVSNPWMARIRINGVQTFIGNFKSAELAHSAYLEAKRANHKGSTI